MGEEEAEAGRGVAWVALGAVVCFAPTLVVAEATSPSGGVNLSLIPEDGLDGQGQRWEACQGQQGEGVTLAAGLAEGQLSLVPRQAGKG